MFTRGAFQHLPGIGPKTIAALHARGIRSWQALRETHETGLPGLDHPAPAWLPAVHDGERALAARDLAALVASLHRSDHWRILADFEDEAAYLDIETSGDEDATEVTTIVCKHRGVLHLFTADRGLDGFLGLLDDIRLFVTFNGASFDIPQLEDHFHIPLRDVAHIDLRWSCYHAGLKGGLKEIERTIGLVRPRDLIGMDGGEADWLWRRWRETGNRRLIERLVRYCAADVVGLELLARWLIAERAGREPPVFTWEGLPPEPEPDTRQEAVIVKGPAPAAVTASTMERMRARLRAMQRDG